MTNISSVCMIAKNEGLYLVEWVAHYLTMGFDEIIIYNNLSEDNSHEILSRLNECGIIKYRLWEGEVGESPQISAYRNAAANTNSKYIAFFDADEFLVLKNYNFINNFLLQFINKPEIAVIAFNWRMFGDNGQTNYSDGLLRDRFNKCDIGGNSHLKSFTRLDKLVFVNNMHICDVEGEIVHPSGMPISMSHFGLSNTIELECGQVNHYFCKSKQEYLNKKARGVADVIDGSDAKFSKYDENIYNIHNTNDEIDETINKNRPLFDEVYNLVNDIAEGKIKGIFAKTKIFLLNRKLHNLENKELSQLNH